MTADEYEGLVAFIAPRFDAMMAGLSEVRTGLSEVRTDLSEVRTRLTRVEIGQERQGGEIRQLAEGLGSFREEVYRRFDQVDVRQEEHAAFFRTLLEEQWKRTDGLERRVTRLEERA